MRLIGSGDPSGKAKLLLIAVIAWWHGMHAAEIIAKEGLAF